MPARPKPWSTYDSQALKLKMMARIIAMLMAHIARDCNVHGTFAPGIMETIELSPGMDRDSVLAAVDAAWDRARARIDI
jgi:hypothetical protein